MGVGVVLPIEEALSEFGPPPSYARVRTLALKAEELGFHSIWTGDHLLFRRFEMTPTVASTQGAWESWTILTALAEATSRIRLGPWVTATPLRNPAIVAKMAATMDEVSDGRFILGLGSGWNQPTFDAFGVPFDHLVDRLAEALQIIVPLLREGHVDFEGTYYSARDCEIVPRGPSPNGPPILIAAERPRMLGLAARYADLWNRSSGYPEIPANRQEFLAGMDQACAQVGRDPATLALTVRMFIGFPDVGPMPSIFTAGTFINGREGAAETLRAYAALGASRILPDVSVQRSSPRGAGGWRGDGASEHLTDVRTGGTEGWRTENNASERHSPRTLAGSFWSGPMPAKWTAWSHSTNPRRCSPDPPASRRPGSRRSVRGTCNCWPAGRPSGEKPRRRFATVIWR